MSPKPVNVPRALETLRQERPTEAQTEALLATVHRPVRHRPYARPLAFAMMTAALALALVFPPRTRAGSAWAQTLANTLNVPASHSVLINANGTVGMERWRSGEKEAILLYDREGNLMMESRTDGRQRFNFMDWTRNDKETRPANARRWAMLSKAWHTPDGWDVRYDSLDALLKRPALQVVSHEEAKDGQPERYRLKLTKPYKTEFTVEIDPTVRRIKTLIEGKDHRTSFDYPATIPDRVFEPRAQRAKGVETFDVVESGKILQRRLRTGLGRQGPVTLRAVLLTGGGDLWAFWTGALPDSKLARPFSIPGVRCGFPFTNKVYTSDWKASPKINGVRTETKGPRLGGMARSPLTKIGAKVDLDVPYPGGVARFRGAPVLRVGYIQNMDAVLGVKREYR